MSKKRLAITRRLSQSFRDTPYFNLDINVEMIEVKKSLNWPGDKSEAKSGIKNLVNNLLIEAVAITMKDHPRPKSPLSGEQVKIHRL